MTDQKLIELLRTEKVHQAFSRLYQYQRTFKKYVLANTGSTEDADDLFQEGLIILYRKVTHPDFVLTSSLNTLLFGICRNLWLEQLRKKKVSISTLNENITQDADIDNENRYRFAENALTRITTTCQEILRLFYLTKLSMHEIASQLGYSSDNAAKTQKYKCLEKARENYLQLLSDSNTSAL